MNTDITVVLGAFAGMLLGFYGIARAMLSQAAKDRTDDRNERRELSKAIKDMAGATGRVADATKQAGDEAKQRNGHLAELILQSKKDGEDIANSAIATITGHIDKQSVKTQTIEHQHVKNKE